MPLYYNISSEPQVLDWSKPAIQPGGAVEVTDAQAAGLSSTIWSPTPPAEKVQDEAPEKPKKNASNQSGGSLSKRDQPAPEPPKSEDTPAASEAPAPDEEAK